MAAKKPARAHLPPAQKSFFSMREVRITSTSGHTAVLQANTPHSLPRPLWEAATKAGAIEYDPALIRAAAAAIEKVEQRPARSKPKLSFAAALEQAITTVVEAGNPADLSKTTGAPKVAPVKKVMVALGVAPKGLTNEQIYDTFTALVASSASEGPADDESADEVPDTADLEDEDGLLEPVGKGVAALVGDAEEADSDEE